MESLPTEIKEHIFKYLGAGSLHRVLGEVCSEWRDIAQGLLRDRIAKMEDFFGSHPLFEEEIRAQLPFRDEGDPHKVLEVYEMAFIPKGFSIKRRKLGQSSADFIMGLSAKRGCDCRRQNLCLVRSLHVMMCRQLLIVQFPEKVQFYSAGFLCGDDGNDVPQGPYMTSVLGSTVANVWIDNNTHTAVSVYQDLILSQETSTRVLILFKVDNVDHTSQNLVLENVRRVFLPLWSCDLILLNKTVCALFTTGSIGVWDRETDYIEVSRNACADVQVMRDMQMSKMYSAGGGLVLVKIVTENTVCWSIFSSNCKEEITVIPLDLNELVSRTFLNSRDACQEIIEIFFTMNVVIIHCVDSQQEPTSSTQPAKKGNKYSKTSCRKLLCKRLKSQPTLNDFSNLESFQNLFDEVFAEVVITHPLECLTRSFLFLSETAETETIRLIGLSDFLRDCSSRSGQVTVYSI